MIRWEQWMDVKQLHRQGLSKREIARQTGLSRNTVAKLLRQPAPEPFHKPARASSLDAFKPYLSERWDKYRLRAPRLMEEIQAQGYSGCINLVQRYLKTLRDTEVVKQRATVRFETAPGQQAQADWAHVGEDEFGKIYAFVTVLSFSRMLYVQFTRSMQTQELIRCHQGAFEYFGGVPACVLFDNQAQVRLSSGDWNALFWDFSAHFGFTPRTHRPYRPRTKGKVERMVDYLKDNFLLGRAFAGFDDLAAQGRLWLEQANSRVHATTGERPRDLLAREKLAPLSLVRPYVLARRQERRVDAEGYVHAASARYSVPPSYVGKRVVVVMGEQRIEVRHGDTLVAEHTRGAPGDCVAAAEHVEAMWKQTLERSVDPPSTLVDLRAADRVVVPPLTHYDELAQAKIPHSPFAGGAQ
jgi:transposase